MRQPTLKTFKNFINEDITPKKPTVANVSTAILKDLKNAKIPLKDRLEHGLLLLISINDNQLHDDLEDWFDPFLGDSNLDPEKILDKLDGEIADIVLDLLGIPDEPQYQDVIADTDFIENNLAKLVAQPNNALKLFDIDVANQEAEVLAHKHAESLKKQKSAEMVEYLKHLKKLDSKFTNTVIKHLDLDKNTKLTLPTEWEKFNKRDGNGTFPELIIQSLPDKELFCIPIDENGQPNLKGTPYMMKPHDPRDRRDSGRMPVQGYMFLKLKWEH